MQRAQTKHFTAAAVLLTFVSIAAALNTPRVTSTRRPDLGLGIRKNDTNIQERGSGVPVFATFGSDVSNGSGKRNIGDIGNRPYGHDRNTTFGSGRNISSDTQSSQGRRVNGTSADRQPTSRNVTQRFGEGDGTVVRELPGVDSVLRDRENRSGIHSGLGSGSRGVSFGRDDGEHRGLGSGRGQTGSTGGRGLPGTLGGHEARTASEGASFGGSGSEHSTPFGSFDHPSSHENGGDQREGSEGRGQPGILGDHERRPGIQDGNVEGRDTVHDPTRGHRPSSVGGGRDQTEGTEEPGSLGHPGGHRGFEHGPGARNQGGTFGLDSGSGTLGDHEVPGTPLGSNGHGNKSAFPGIFVDGNHGAHEGRFGNRSSTGNDSLGRHDESGTFGGRFGNRSSIGNDSLGRHDERGTYGGRFGNRSIIGNGSLGRHDERGTFGGRFGNRSIIGNGSLGRHDESGTLGGRFGNRSSIGNDSLGRHDESGTFGGRFGNRSSISNDSLGRHDESGTFGEHSPRANGRHDVTEDRPGIGFGSGSRNGNHGSEGHRGIGSSNRSSHERGHGIHGHTLGGRDGSSTDEERSRPGGLGSNVDLENNFSRPLGVNRNGTVIGHPILGSGTRGNSTGIGSRNQQPTQSSLDSVNSTVGRNSGDGHSSGTNGHGLAGQPEGSRGLEFRHGQGSSSSKHANQRRGQESNTLSTAKPGGLTSGYSTSRPTGGLERMDGGR